MNEAGSPHRRIVLLAAQGFALGLTAAWIMIPASAIFLSAYGPDLLPVTYIGAACVGVVSSILLASALRRRPLASVAARVLAGLSIALLASCVALRSADFDWVAFAWLVIFPIVVPLGFVFIVGQAGMLLGVRDLKAFYARVVAGFALGFVVGGVTGPLLLSVLGATEDLLAAAAAAGAAFLALVVATRRRYPAELLIVEQHGPGAERPTLRMLTRSRYVMLIVAFQMLSAVESQWLDFLVFDRASQRYADSTELARFISRFSAIAYGTDIVFLLLLAGLLLRRFGLRYGLTANAVGVLALLGAIVVASAIQGSGATMVFVLIVAARVTDLTLADGSSRTSLSAAYQAVPARSRAVAQAMVEGLAVPVAIGISGAGLLVVDAVGGLDGVMVPLLTTAVVAAWAVVATVLYREYGTNLLANLRGRTLDPADLTVDDEASLVVIDRLVESADERDVRLGLDILTVAEHPDLPERLERLVADERVGVRTDALQRLAEVAPHLGAAAARDGLDDPAAGVRAASIRVLGSARSEWDLARIKACSNDIAPEVKAAAAFARTRIGDDAVRDEVASEISALGRSEVASERMVAALMLAECERGTTADRATLRLLLADPDPDVVRAALAAVRSPDASDLIAEVSSLLDERHTAAAAVDALVRIGAAALRAVDEELRTGAGSRRSQELLVRVGREIGGPAAVAVLRRHVEHNNREVGLAAMRALATLGSSLQFDADIALTESEVAAADLEHATHVSRMLVAFRAEPAAQLLCSALRDELELLRRRVLAALSLRYGAEGLQRVAFQLAQRDDRSHALALEWLDVTLSGAERGIVALLDPDLSDRDRLNALMRWFPVPPMNSQDIWLDLVLDRDDRWRRPWIKACALYAASEMASAEFAALTVADDEAGIVRETLAGIRSRRLDLV